MKLSNEIGQILDTDAWKVGCADVNATTADVEHPLSAECMECHEAVYVNSGEDMFRLLVKCINHRCRSKNRRRKKGGDCE